MTEHKPYILITGTGEYGAVKHLADAFSDTNDTNSEYNPRYIYPDNFDINEILDSKPEFAIVYENNEMLTKLVLKGIPTVLIKETDMEKKTTSKDIFRKIKRQLLL